MKPSVDIVAKWFALAWAASASAYLLVAPAYGTSSSTTGGHRSTGATLLDIVGVRLLIVLAIPVLSAATALVPVSSSAHRWLLGMSAAATTGFVVLGALTVGLFFLPTAVALVVVFVRALDPPRTT